MSRKKPEAALDDSEQEVIKYNSPAYAIVKDGENYKILLIKLNLDKKLVGEISVLDEDSDLYTIQDKFMIEMEDRLYEIE
jgi:hypothetical protein